ncbi:MAG: N-acetylmuramoyl-L-alanine amidase, partial [Gammaproteobacteria bacterium]
GFTVHTGINPSWFEVAVATDPKLFNPGSKALRNHSNFYSSRASSPLPAERGEAVYLLPPPVLARFAGKDHLYYTMATFQKPDFNDPEIVRLPSEAIPSIFISKSFTGRSRRLAMPNARGGLTGNGNGYNAAGPESLNWAGDSAVPGRMEPIANTPVTPQAGASAPAAQSGVALAYDDGFDKSFWSKPQQLPEEQDRGIEGPIPDQASSNIRQPFSLSLSAPEYPQAARFEPAASGNYRHSTSPRTIGRVVIHITDGGPNINGTISWFKNPDAQVSAHYVVGQDGEVVQMVPHSDVAWHASGANSDSIGIEHVANTQGLTPTPAEYCSSAALVRWLCDQYGIPIDRTHILGHSEADPRT